MTAGNGTSHSEDSAAPPGRQATGNPQRLHAVQLWIALPTRNATRALFRNYAQLPLIGRAGSACACWRAVRSAPARRNFLTPGWTRPDCPGARPPDSSGDGLL